VDDATLRRAYDDGKAAWPQVILSFEAYRSHCERVFGDGEPGWDWTRYAADLYLCCACAAGDPDATRALEKDALPQIVKAISRIDADSEFVKEALQTLRHKLLVGDKPKIADYAGRGSLVAWLSVAGARVALDAVRSRKARKISHADLPEKLAQDHETSPLSDIVRSRYRDSFQRALRSAVSALPSRDRNLLRLQLVGGCSIDQLGKMYLVHRATAARWLESARTRVFESVRAQMKKEHRLTDGEFDSIARGVRSQLDLSITATINDLSSSSGSSETDGSPRDPDSEPE
jgi:RNA polymerase sigma-70 factor (ECF subfamily)